MTFCTVKGYVMWMFDLSFHLVGGFYKHRRASEALHPEAE
jgi:hypothetical protein